MLQLSSSGSTAARRASRAAAHPLPCAAGACAATRDSPVCAARGGRGPAGASRRLPAVSSGVRGGAGSRGQSPPARCRPSKPVHRHRCVQRVSAGRGRPRPLQQLGPRVLVVDQWAGVARGRRSRTAASLRRRVVGRRHTAVRTDPQRLRRSGLLLLQCAHVADQRRRRTHATTRPWGAGREPRRGACSGASSLASSTCPSCAGAARPRLSSCWRRSRCRRRRRAAVEERQRQRQRSSRSGAAATLQRRHNSDAAASAAARAGQRRAGAA